MLAHLGLIIVPLGYSDGSLFKAGSPYGATCVTKGGSEMPGEDDLAVARYQGRRLAAVAKNLTSVSEEAAA